MQGELKGRVSTPRAGVGANHGLTALCPEQRRNSRSRFTRRRGQCDRSAWED